MRGFLALFSTLAAASVAQELPRFEVMASGWRTSAEGTLQSGILPVDLQSDLGLNDRTQFFGTLIFRPGERHGIVVEGAPLKFRGVQTLSRQIEYNGRIYTLSETVRSKAELNYLFAGYQYEFLARERGHAGFRVGGAMLDATGSIESVTTGIRASRSYRIGLPLVGFEGRVWLLPRFIDAEASVQGMSLGGYGHFVQGVATVGFSVAGVGIRGGYRVIDADVHERGGLGAGVAPRFSGPTLGITFRR